MKISISSILKPLKLKILLGFLPFLLLYSACQKIKIHNKPIVFDEHRIELSLQYMRERHGIIQKTPSIVPKIIVIHWTAIPSLEKSFEIFKDSELPSTRSGILAAGRLNVSAQYLVDQEGRIYQLLPDTVFARHVIGLNYCSIGIENVGNGTDMPLTEAQLKSNISLIEHLQEKYPVEYLIGHYEYKKFIGHRLWKEKDPDYLTEKTDPGETFMVKLRESLKERALKGPPS